MKNILFSLFAASMAVSSAAQAITQAEAETKCRAYAQEDGVAAEELKDYVAECVKDLMQAGTENSGTGSTSDSK